MLVSVSRPIAAIIMPPPMSGRGPIFGRSFVDALVALMTIATVIGRNARPDSIGENAERLLQVVRQEQEHREHAGARQEHREQRPAAIAVEDDRAAAAAGSGCAAG